VTPTLSVEAFQESVICEVELTTPANEVGVDGATLSDTGAEVTLITVDLLSVPPRPVQLRLKVELVVKAIVVKVPDVPLDPLQEPEEVQEVALVEVQVRTTVFPVTTDEALEERVVVTRPAVVALTEED
jgi:hypothetical protein